MGDGGRISCCWQSVSGGSTLIFERPAPKTLYVRWRQIEEEILYEATLELAADLAKQMRNLPEYTWISSGEQGREEHLVVGMEADGGVTVWLTNARSDNNREGRVFQVVGTGQAVGRHEPLPDAPWR
ncbi:DUF2931 family protein [Alkalilimnicola ehrlichii]|uniref:DUF2931 family protein n=1 Tax=Alkalilimnicola ehrlichii TaxID=351052 RepID=UPI0015F269FD|nr:DUF2931 family protein [Alkalilimnicola ehrlichii]